MKNLTSLLLGVGVLLAIPAAGVGVAAFVLLVIIPNQDWLVPLGGLVAFGALAVWAAAIAFGIWADR